MRRCCVACSTCALGPCRQTHLDWNLGYHGHRLHGGGHPDAVDDAGAIYLVSGNGKSDMVANFGNSILKLDPTATKVADFFTPFDVEALNDGDADLMGGPVIVPGTNLVIGSGKEGVVYVLDRTKMGHQSPNDAQIAQRLDTGGPLIFNMALWNRPDGHSGRACADEGLHVSNSERGAIDVDQ